MTPLVEFMNPNGSQPFILGSGGFASLLSAPMNTNIKNPYARHHTKIDYSRWLMANTSRCWRQTIQSGTLDREDYPTDGPLAEDFTLPS